MSELPKVGDLKEALEQIEEARTLTIDNEQVECKVVDPDDQSLFPDSTFDESPDYIKTAQIEARQATENGTLEVSQDGTTYDYEAGDWIIKNPNDNSEYLFGNPEKDNVQQRQDKFAKTYKAVEGQSNKFVSAKAPFKVIKVPVDIAFEKWGDWQGIKAGGVMTRQHDGGKYGIDQQSFEKDYGVQESDDEEAVTGSRKEVDDVLES